ncbi:flagellar basal body P-ring formation chaperone FlgA [Thioclava sp. FR2]|uniref:flagellar basal body P-ring formation chaperone FlgA n=1 Tax=Thioclava sp. FR2 TaxID=3445780 RepID=UPI003EBA3A11
MMLWLLFFMIPTAVSADAVVSSRIIRSGSIIGANDLSIASISVSGAAQSVDEIVGLEAKSIIYPGRPILYAQVTAPAIVERNQKVPLIFHSGGLEILTEGKALSRASVGEIIRVLNPSSRKIVTGIVKDDGSVHVEVPTR